MHFTKMHGLGNDYLYVYGEVPDDVLKDMLDKAYQIVFGSLSRKKQKEILGTRDPGLCEEEFIKTVDERVKRLKE